MTPNGAVTAHGTLTASFKCVRAVWSVKAVRTDPLKTGILDDEKKRARDLENSGAWRDNAPRYEARPISAG